MEEEKFETPNVLSPEIQAAKNKFNALQLKIVRAHDIESLGILQEEISEFAEKLQKEFPDDYLKYSAYHILGGSGMMTAAERMDFEGEFSVIKFIDNLEAKFTEAK